jgi:uncharacterized membrane protein SpoIIM required for sporulation
MKKVLFIILGSILGIVAGLYTIGFYSVYNPHFSTPGEISFIIFQTRGLVIIVPLILSLIVGTAISFFVKKVWILSAILFVLSAVVVIFGLKSLLGII